jgi:hypothetical protein
MCGTTQLHYSGHRGQHLLYLLSVHVGSRLTVSAKPSIIFHLPQFSNWNRQEEHENASFGVSLKGFFHFSYEIEQCFWWHMPRCCCCCCCCCCNASNFLNCSKLQWALRIHVKWRTKRVVYWMGTYDIYSRCFSLEVNNSSDNFL